MADDDDVAARIDPGLSVVRSRPVRSRGNPFNPGFGTPPPRLAGRNELVADVVGRLERGPGRYEFHTVLVGARGVGKTVVLAEILSQASSRNRLVVVQWNASRSLRQVLVEHRAVIEGALAGTLRRRLRNVDIAVKAAPGGVGAEAHLNAAGSEQELSAYGLLAQYARAAAARHATLVVAADELQAAAPADLQELVAALQQLANVERLPVALVAVGLPSTGHLLRRSDVSPGFVERLEALRVDNLDPASTRDAIETPFLDAGRDIEPAAVEMMVAATRGYPYAIQVVGHACWEAAGDRQVVTLAAAEQACRGLRALLEGQVFGPRWEAMSDGDRQYLAAAARLADDQGVVASGDVAHALGRGIEAVSRNRDRLINQHHVLVPVERGVMRFSVPGFAEWISRQPSHVQVRRREQLGRAAPRSIDPGPTR